MRRAALALATLAIGALALGARADAYIYWANDATPQHSVVGRAGLDGTGIDQSFIPSANITEGVAVDSTYIYWTNVCSGAIGRANIDGSGVLNQTFITGANSPPGCGPPAIAVDHETHLLDESLKRRRSGAPTSTAAASTRASLPPVSASRG